MNLRNYRVVLYSRTTDRRPSYLFQDMLVSTSAEQVFCEAVSSSTQDSILFQDRRAMSNREFMIQWGGLLTTVYAFFQPEKLEALSSYRAPYKSTPQFGHLYHNFPLPPIVVSSLGDDLQDLRPEEVG